MADQGHGEAEAGAVAPESEATIDARPAVVSPPVASRRRELWLVAALALIVAGIALSPFWAPEIAPLLPWGASLPAPTPDYAALAARLEAIERRPAAPAIDVGAIEPAQGALERRVDRLEAIRNPERQSEAAVAPIKAGL